jgi:hypothetical protein
MDVHVDALIQRPQEAISEEPRSITYVSGKRMEPNANYGLVRAHFDEAEYALKRVERQKSAKDAECTSFKSVPQSSQSSQEDPCDEAKLLAERYGERNTELEKATKQLRETPKEVAIEVYSTFNYVVRNHIWSSGYHFTVQTNTPGAPTPLRQQGTLRFEDKEHVGLAVAKLREDPLVVPLPDAYSKAFLAQLGSAVTSMVRADGEVRGSARRAQCQELPADWSIPWVQCWAEASLWGSAREGDGVGFLQVLATSAEGTSSPRCR